MVSLSRFKVDWQKSSQDDSFHARSPDYIQLVDLSLSIRLSTVDSGTGRAGFDVGSSYLVTAEHFKSPNKITRSCSARGGSLLSRLVIVSRKQRANHDLPYDVCPDSRILHNNMHLVTRK